MKLTFWGVMGSCPGVNRELVEYGISTPCVEVEINDKIIIFDCGTGIYNMSRSLSYGKSIDMDMFLTHTHWDHIQGLPFFTALYNCENSIRIYGEKRQGLPLRDVLESTMGNPYFPVDSGVFKADISYIELESGQVVKLNDDISISTLETYHPDRNLAYRLNYKDKSIVYLTDFDHGQIDESIVAEFIRNTDILIYDGHFTDEEYDLDMYKGWGHSTWQRGIYFAKEYGVKKLFIFHHAPHRSLEEMKCIEKQIAEMDIDVDVVMSREGMSIEV